MGVVFRFTQVQPRGTKDRPIEDRPRRPVDLIAGRKLRAEGVRRGREEMPVPTKRREARGDSTSHERNNRIVH